MNPEDLCARINHPPDPRKSGEKKVRCLCGKRTYTRVPVNDPKSDWTLPKEKE